MSGFLQFWRDDSGQDLVEYSLIITFIAIACVGLMFSGQSSTNAIWSAANSRLIAANTVASS
jgi:Flp pilus assembly pilin Flp